MDSAKADRIRELCERYSARSTAPSASALAYKILRILAEKEPPKQDAKTSELR